MGYFEYRDLAPIDNIENGDKYIEALNWAFQNKKVKNIALTGPYGAGKSSVIETFLAQDDKKNNKGFPFRANTIRKKSLKISMATFFKGKALENAESGEKIEVDADEVEKGILKQLFYKVEPGKIPQSRYRKIHKIKLSPVMVHIFGAMTLITFLSAIFAPEKYNTFVQTINNFLSIESAPNIKTYSFMGILFLVTAGVIAYLYRTVISRFRIKEVKLPSDTTIQSGREESDSVFNKNLDEIMYFFEATGYRIVFFEDLDRLDSPKIFVHLSLMYQRNNKNYEMLINICYFVLDGMLQTTDKGNYKMMTFSDEHMHRLYEKFVLEYFKRHHSYLSEVRAAQVKWNLATDTEESMIRFLPAMQTDIFLRYKEKVLIIDTKYYGNSMQKQYDKVTIHSGNMYQIFTYVKNQDVENNGRVSGMLLYAKTEEAITPDCSFVIGGNKISVKTVDLNKEFKLIAAQLDKIAEDYFGKKRIEDSII